MCTGMTKTYDIMVGLRQLLCMCKAEKIQLNDRVTIGGFCVQRTVAEKSTKDRNLKFDLNMLYNQYNQALKYYAGNL